MMRIVPIWRYSGLRCDLIKCVKWFVKCLILYKYGKMTNILCSKDNNFHSIGLLNPKNIGADINITFLLHLVLDISLLLQKKLLLWPSWRPSWILKFAQVGFHGTFDMLFVGILWTYSKKISLLRILFTSNPQSLGTDVSVWFSACPLIFMYIREVTQVPDVPVVAARNGHRWCIWTIIQV